MLAVPDWFVVRPGCLHPPGPPECRPARGRASRDARGPRPVRSEARRAAGVPLRPRQSEQGCSRSEERESGPLFSQRPYAAATSGAAHPGHRARAARPTGRTIDVRTCPRHRLQVPHPAQVLQHRLDQRWRRIQYAGQVLHTMRTPGPYQLQQFLQQASISRSTHHGTRYACCVFRVPSTLTPASCPLPLPSCISPIRGTRPPRSHVPPPA